MSTIQFLWTCWMALRNARRKKIVTYFAVMSRGVPQITCLIATDREAWRLSSVAVQASELRGPKGEW